MTTPPPPSTDCEFSDRGLARYHSTYAFASAQGPNVLARFTRMMEHLANYGGTSPEGHKPFFCLFSSDDAPHSLSFTILRRADRTPVLHGGLIYSGPGQPLDGSGPAFTVSLSPSTHLHDWSVHT